MFSDKRWQYIPERTQQSFPSINSNKVCHICMQLGLHARSVQGKGIVDWVGPQREIEAQYFKGKKLRVQGKRIKRVGPNNRPRPTHSKVLTFSNQLKTSCFRYWLISQLGSWLLHSTKSWMLIMPRMRWKNVFLSFFAFFVLSFLIFFF